MALQVETLRRPPVLSPVFYQAYCRALQPKSHARARQTVAAFRRSARHLGRTCRKLLGPLAPPKSDLVDMLVEAAGFSMLLGTFLTIIYLLGG